MLFNPVCLVVDPYIFRFDGLLVYLGAVIGGFGFPGVTDALHAFLQVIYTALGCGI
ncbi:MAG: hypothetical protein U1A27_07870 [Phycisphaerae bacterium]